MTGRGDGRQTCTEGEMKLACLRSSWKTRTAGAGKQSCEWKERKSEILAGLGMWCLKRKSKFKFLSKISEYCGMTWLGFR